MIIGVSLVAVLTVDECFDKFSKIACICAFFYTDGSGSADWATRQPERVR